VLIEVLMEAELDAAAGGYRAVAQAKAALQELEQVRAAAEQEVEQVKAAAEQEVEQVKAAAEQEVEQVKAAAEQEVEQVKAAAVEAAKEVAAVSDKLALEKQAVASLAAELDTCHSELADAQEEFRVLRNRIQMQQVRRWHPSPPPPPPTLPADIDCAARSPAVGCADDGARTCLYGCEGR
jgi:chromosome segregation ATPase